MKHPAVAKSKTVGDTFAMKHLLTTALMFFCLLVTPSWSWEKIIKCKDGNTYIGSSVVTIKSVPLKVKKPFLGKPKIYERIEGQWKENCGGVNDTIEWIDNSFICKFNNGQKLIIDLDTNQIDYKLLDNGKLTEIKFTECEVK